MNLNGHPSCKVWLRASSASSALLKLANFATKLTVFVIGAFCRQTSKKSLTSEQKRESTGESKAAEKRQERSRRRKSVKCDEGRYRRRGRETARGLVCGLCFANGRASFEQNRFAVSSRSAEAIELGKALSAEALFFLCQL